MLSYLLALLEILFKVWQASDRVQAIKELSNAEKFVLFVTVQLLIQFGIWLAFVLNT